VLLFWRIRYLDTRDKEFKDRDLALETHTLDPAVRAAVEATYELKDIGRRRDMLRYRNLFREDTQTPEELEELCKRSERGGWVFIHDYFEDEDGQELTSKRMALILTGDPDADLLPDGLAQHDVNYIQAQKNPIKIDKITVSQDQLNVLGYFARDLHELLGSAFCKDGPGTLSGPNGRT
jgi:hypothetical protein